MTRENLERILFGERTLVYAVLDGASIPDLRMRLYETNPPHFCLFRGDLEPDVAEAAPYLVGLLREQQFTEWLLNQGLGENRGIFVHSRHSLIEMRKHFRGLVQVAGEEGNPMIFRFYDPRVLIKFLPTCEDEERKEFFGKITTFFAEDEKGTGLVTFKLENNALKQDVVG
jgi:hypothetical protein